MDLPVLPPVKPMLAKVTSTVPRESGLRYEPKWDGFRCIVFRDGDEVLRVAHRPTRSLPAHLIQTVADLGEQSAQFRSLTKDSTPAPPGGEFRFPFMGAWHRWNVA